MSLLFNEEQILLRNTVREFAENEVAPRMPEILKTNEFPRNLYKRAGELGFWRLNIPEKHGGFGKGMVETCIVMEELAKVSPAMSLVVEIGIVDIPLLLEEPALYKYLEPCMSGDKILSGAATDPKGQSNSAEWEPLAVKDGNEWVLNGTRLYNTNNLSDIHMTLGLTQDREMKAFFIEKGTPGYDNSRVDLKYGMAGSGGGTTIYKDCRIPLEMACNVGIGDSQFYYRIYNNCAAEALGCAEGILEKTIKFCKLRTHDFKPLTSLQVVSQKLGYLRTLVEVAHSAVYDAATMFDELCKNHDPELERAWAIKAESIKLFVSETAVKVATECIKLHGGMGYHNPELHHYVGDAMCYCIMDLSNDIHWDNLALLMGLTEG